MTVAFAPVDRSTVTLSGSTTPTAVTAIPLAPGSGPYQVRVFNLAGAVAYVRLGGVASSADLPMPAGGVEVLTVQPGVTTISVVLASGTGNVYATLGSGI